MGHRPQPPAKSLRVLVLHNNDYRHLDPESPHYASLADVENAARGIGEALARRGHAPEIAGVDADTLPELLLRLDEARPDLVFNLCESLRGDSRHAVVVPALLELS